MDKNRQETPQQVNLSNLLHIKNCVDAVKACLKRGAWNEGDLPTFSTLLDEAVKVAIEHAERNLC